MTIRYDSTDHGVMVQVHLTEPTDTEWAGMLDFMLSRKDTIKAVFAIVRSESGPTSKQRADLADALKQMRPTLPCALLTNSRIARGVLTAMAWLTRKQQESRAFALDAVEDALSFLALDEQEKASARALASKLGGLSPPARSAASAR